MPSIDAELQGNWLRYHDFANKIKMLHQLLRAFLPDTDARGICLYEAMAFSETLPPIGNYLDAGFITR